MYRIQNINDHIALECLAERTHIYVDWPALGRGEISGSIHFENAWYVVDRATGAYIAKDSRPAPALTLTLQEAMTYGLPIPEPITVLTGAHVNALLRALHAAKMEELLAPTLPTEPAADPQPE